MKKKKDFFLKLDQPRDEVYGAPKQKNLKFDFKNCYGAKDKTCDVLF